MRKLGLVACLVFVIIIGAFAQKRGEREVLKLSAAVSEDPTQITLTWNSVQGANTYRIYRRESFDTSNFVTPIQTNLPTDTQYVDTDVAVGKGYEYYITTNAGSTTLHGYMYSGIKKESESYMGNVLLLIDSTYIDALSTEINRLEEDLKNEGWNVVSVYVNRSTSAIDVKAKIAQQAQMLDDKLKSIFILGHVKVPYSGNYGGAGALPPPDGHVVGRGGHTGAWSADTYYACFGGQWTDNSVNNTTGSRSRNHNVVGDGHFDQSRLPGEVTYEIGRVDMYDMPAFAKSDTELVRDYLNRNHLYRTAKLHTVKRALVDDNFGSLNLSSTGWHNFTTIYPLDSVSEKDYFTEMKAAPYQWSFGCGAGSYTSCNGVGRTTDFAADSLQSIFTILAGSYFGDWDIRNNLLKAPLANSALVSFWGGIPKWYIHTMALGKNIGFGTRESMNNRGEYFTGNFNLSYKSVHMALMGDPTLKLNYTAGPKNAAASSAENHVTVTWEAAEQKVDGYYIYEMEDYQRAHYKRSELLTELTFVDSNKRRQGDITYMVRSVTYDTTNSGSYEILSPAIYATVNHTYDRTLNIEDEISISSTKLYPNPSNGSVNVQLPIALESGVSIKVLSLAGKTVQQHEFETTENCQFNVGELPAGLYLVELSVGGLQVHKSLSVVK